MAISGASSGGGNESNMLNVLNSTNEIDDPLLVNLNEFIGTVKEKISEVGKAQVKTIGQMYRDYNVGSAQ